jgi:RND family efflux transporter MFP subunit
MGAAAARDRPPVTVDVSRPVERMVGDFADFTGRLEAAQRVDLRARVSGYLDKVHFKAGAKVRKGELLFEIDPRPYQADLNKVEAELAVAQAGLKRSEVELARARDLLAKSAISREDFDKVASNQVFVKAQVAVARATVQAARLKLDFTRIRAPIDGTIGLPRVTPGNLVVADSTRLATIVSAEPIYVYFDMDERTFLRWRRSVRAQQGKADRTTLTVALAGEHVPARRAVLDAVDNLVNPSTGTVRMRGTMANPSGLLVPGMFVRVRIEFGEKRKVLLVPNDVVWRGTSSEKRGTITSVLVVNDKNVIVRRSVTEGRSIDGMVIIEGGLKPDDWVVVDDWGVTTGNHVKPHPIAMPTPRHKD